MEQETSNNSERVAPPITTGSADSVLASLFRSILLDLHVNMFKFNTLVNDFIEDQTQASDLNEKDKSSAKGNLKRELLADKMSWKVFCKGLKFLNIIKFEIRIRAYHRNGKLTEHYKIINTDKDHIEQNLPFTPE